jgi:hypothetical protein
LGTVVALKGILSKLFLNGYVHFIEETFIALLLVFPVFFLIACLIAILQHDISIELEVEH